MILNRSPDISFQCSYYMHTRKTANAPLWFYLSMHHNHFNNLGRGSPKEHLFQIIFKSGLFMFVHYFLKFHYIYT